MCQDHKVLKETGGVDQKNAISNGDREKAQRIIENISVGSQQHMLDE